LIHWPESTIKVSSILTAKLGIYMISRAIYIKKIKASLLLSAAIFLLSPAVVTAEVLDRVVAIVNDDIITLSELDEAGEEFLQKIQSSAPDHEIEKATKTANETILNQLIKQRLVSQEAKKAGVGLTDAEFEQAYQRNIKTVSPSREEWLKKLKEAGISEETYKTNLRNQLLRDKLVLYEIRSRIIVTEGMITDYYTSEYTTESQGSGYYLMQMGFAWGKDDEVKSNTDLLEADKARALEKAKQVRQQVIDGGDFAQLAVQNSDLPSAADGGDLGLFQKDELAEYMREPVLSLQVSELTPVIETPNGYQFFKLVSVSEGGVVHKAPLFEVKEEIRKKLFEQKFKEEYQEWVEGIREGAYIKIMLY